MATHKSQKGSGGKRGHSNQDNWVTHQEEKAIGRLARRQEGKDAERQATTNGFEPGKDQT